MIEIIKKIPIVNSIARKIYRNFFHHKQPFSGSNEYWNQRYSSGGNSGPGSYDELAEFKATILNKFVQENKILSVIEFGCGDGNQLALANYPRYSGFDISEDAIMRCKQIFSNDPTKTFNLVRNYSGEQAQLSLSLDVIFHLVEDNIFIDYMNRLFDAATNYVIIYSSNTENNDHNHAAHVRHRQFSSWVEENRPGWKFIEIIPNRYPYKENDPHSSFSDFFIYQKLNQ